MNTVSSNFSRPGLDMGAKRTQMRGPSSLFTSGILYSFDLLYLPRSGRCSQGGTLSKLVTTCEMACEMVRISRSITGSTLDPHPQLSLGGFHVHTCFGLFFRVEAAIGAVYSWESG